MKKPTSLSTVKVFVRGVEIDVHGVTAYPYVPATQIDPPEEPFCEWESVTIGGVEADGLFHGKLADELQEAVSCELEAV
jgi:hypothetical protein